MAWFNTKTRAFSLIEVLFAVSLFAVLTTAVVILSVSSLQREARLSVDNEAQAYVEEGLEAARNIRDQDYLNLETGTHGLALGTGGWSFSESSDSIDAYFTRVISVEDVYRDSNGDIVSSGGDLDPNTKYVQSTVTWFYRGILPRSLSMETYLSNWSAYDWMQTTCSEFSGGTHSSTATQAAAAPPEDNCVLNLQLVEESGDFFVSTDIGEHGNDVVVEGDYAYVATHKSNEGLAIVDISDINSPTLLDSIDVEARGRYVYKYGDVLYVGVQSNTKGLAVLDVSDPTNIVLEESINIGGYGNQAVVSGDTLFMGVEDSSGGLIIFDVSDPEEPSLLSTLNLGDVVRSVAVDGDYAYVATDDSSAGFQVVDISDTSNPSVVATLEVDSDANSIWLADPIAYVATTSTSDSLQVVDISTPTTPSVLSTLDVGEKIEDLAVSGNYLYVSLDQIDPGMGVINVSSPTAPSLSYTFDVGGKGTRLTLDGDNVYMGVDTANAGLVIVGQADVSLATSGSFVSSVLDTGVAAPRLNYLEWESTEAPGGSIRFQLKTASSSAGLSSAQWVGPDGTSSTYYESSRTAIVIDPASTGTQFVQYIMYLTSDGFSTPSVNSVTVNYTP